MQPGPLPESLRRFILTSVPSVPFVEALLLFRRDPDAPRDAAFVARHLYVGEHAAAEVIAQLATARIVEPVERPSPGFRYRPATSELASLLDALSTYYGTHLVEITDMIHSSRARAAKQFADAFKLRKD